MGQWWLVFRRIYASLGLNELNKRLRYITESAVRDIQRNHYKNEAAILKYRTHWSDSSITLSIFLDPNAIFKLPGLFQLIIYDDIMVKGMNQWWQYELEYKTRNITFQRKWERQVLGRLHVHFGKNQLLFINLAPLSECQIGKMCWIVLILIPVRPELTES